MINYQISSKNPTSQFLNIQIYLSFPASRKVTLQLPAWRAGRYQIADYAQNIRNFQVQTQSGDSILFSKKNKNTWSFGATAEEHYLVSYEYYAAKMDAGSCWVDEEQIYINFVNCMLEIKDSPDEELHMHFDQSGYPNRACTLEALDASHFKAPNFQVLADSTLIAAQRLTHWSYEVATQEFHIWMHGEVHFDQDDFILAHQKFTQRLIQDFGEFPEPTYHFIYQLLPYRHYHGVEHKKGTVITFGPAKNLKEAGAMEDLLGVACHELYHAWNVCQIRPKELLPYDFGRETYTEAGWMLEGITTYMGDLYLLKSGVYDLQTYLKHFNQVIGRESFSQGFQNSSILETSLDLWLDGYQAGIPDKKTSIYTHGALIAFALDLMLLEAGSSLDRVMKKAWRKFGKVQKGYTAEGFWNLFESEDLDSEKLRTFYNQYIRGKENIFSFLSEKVAAIGMELSYSRNTVLEIASIGVVTQDQIIQKIHPESPAYQDLMIGDILEVHEKTESFEVRAKRKNGNVYQFDHPKSEQGYYPEIKLKPVTKTPLVEIWSK